MELIKCKWNLVNICVPFESAKMQNHKEIEFFEFKMYLNVHMYICVDKTEYNSVDNIVKCSNNKHFLIMYQICIFH